GRRQGGFTLLELMVAIGVLAFGITTLLGVLSVGVGSRRGSEMRARSVLLVERVFHDLETRVLPEHDWLELAEDADLAIPELRIDGVEGFPGMRCVVRFDIDPEHPELVLARVRVSWLDDGEETGEEFRRILPRDTPFSQRVASRRSPR